jgi:rod shape-determining protein MreC
MRNIVALLYRFYHFFLFLVLQAVALTLLFTYSNYQRTAFLNGSGEITGWLFDIRTAFTEPFNVKEQNEQLMAENAELRSLIPQNLRPTGDGLVMIDSVSLEQEFTYIPAQVIDISLNKARNFITLNKGSDHGIQREMGVVSAEGIVGFVYDVTRHYSVVIPIQNDLFSTSIKLGGTNDFGVIRWEGGDPEKAIVYGIPASRQLQVGDRIVTKGASARYPESYPVGEIEEFELEPGKSDYRIRVKLYAPFRSLFHVYAIQATFRNEVDSLTQSMEELHD